MAGYVGNVPVPQSVREDQSFTATAGQTTFNTLGYTDGNRIKVFLNGVLLEGGGTDYTATNGSDVVLTSGAIAGDILRFETFNEFNLVNQNLTTPTFTDSATVNSTTTASLSVSGDTTASLTLKNNTHEDTDGGRESTIIFQGEQSGGEISTLAEIEASHDGTSDDEKGDLIFRVNDGNDGTSPTEVLRLDSVGSMGLGASIPASSSTGLYLKGGGATYSTGSTYRYDMVNAYFDTAASAWKYIGNGVATQIYQANGTIIFNRAVANSSGAGAALTWVEEFRIDTDGVKFNGDTAADNGLNDYEEGTWTPTIYSGFSSISGYTYQVGHYIKVGAMVYTDFYLYFSGTGNSANINITGLPFTLSSQHSGLVRGGGVSTYNNITSTIQQFYGTGSTDRFQLYENGNSGTAVSGTQTNKYLIGTFTYKTDS